MRLYKDYLINKVAKQQIPKKLDEKDEIFELIEPLRPSPQSSGEFNK